MKNHYRKEFIWAGFVLLLIGVVGATHAEAAYPYGGYGVSVWDRLSQYIYTALLGAFVGFTLSDAGRGFRKILVPALLLMGAVIGAMGNAILGNFCVFLLSVLVTIFLLKSKGSKAKPTTFGSAEWASFDHLQGHGLIGDQGFHLGVFTDTQHGTHPLHYTGERHLLTVAPTRSGKGIGAIIPNLLTYRGSALVIDPKGENAIITAARRGYGSSEKNIQGMGQKIHVVDPWGITGLRSSRFNPLDWLDVNDEAINENVMILADAMITPHSGGRDQFWDEEAKALLMGLLLHVALDVKEADNRTLGRVRDIISMDIEDMNNILGEMLKSPNIIIRGAASRTLSKEAKLKSSVLASLQSHTHFLDSPRIRESLSVSDFKFEDLKTTEMTVYLVLPSDRLNTFGRWLRLLIQQALTVNARNIETKPKKPVLFLLDEMAALGRLSMVEQAYGLMAGFGMQLWGIVQDLSQLERGV